ncbi:MULTISPECIES: hypothetical protein [unclassified Rhodococcus (in: high G+C Gram-positive bacteria)]|uniref:hypothetical protein n=1 Tax=unclassified Rhodococcus (in: high G+C Gram-positive bacteria) TaxID=192944 RepID=UPI001F2BF041|nr:MULTISPECIES: hypothetical protein [unclassified Rhodococcus (in: high G+C Gram-positive bacteria)]
MTLQIGAGMVPLMIPAKMTGGVAHGLPRGISLDGLLASEIRENTNAAARAADTDYNPYSPGSILEDMDLPLACCTAAGVDGWRWAATFACPEDEVPGPQVQYWSARPDQQVLTTCRRSHRRWCPNSRAATGRG